MVFLSRFCFVMFFCFPVLQDPLSIASNPWLSTNQGSLTRGNWFTPGQHRYTLRYLTRFWFSVNRWLPPAPEVRLDKATTIRSLSHIHLFCVSP